MRLSIASFALAASGLSLLAAAPASAQSYGQVCNDIRNERQAMGAVLGGLAGGLIGNQSAARGARDEGTALGLVVGAIAGSQLAKGDLNCRPREAYPAATTYGQPNYPYNNQPYLEGGPRSYGDEYYPYPDTYGTYPQDSRDHVYRNREHRRESFASPEYGAYTRDDSFAGRECAEAKQITRLPDGTEIHRPIEACRTAYYGEWSVRD